MSKEEPKKNHWYEMYELECLRTKELQNQIETDAKHIIALQKQNGELTDKVKELEEKLANADYQLEGRDLEIKELEKENAELKDYRLKTLKEQQTGIQKYALNLEHKLNWYDDKLTKAKELLKKWVELYKPKLEGYPITPIQEQTEQFLNEVEK
jgi:chromosome segregation ATPase